MVKPGMPGKIVLAASQFYRCPALIEIPRWLKGSVIHPLNQGHFDPPKTKQVTEHVQVYCSKH